MVDSGLGMQGNQRTRPWTIVLAAALLLAVSPWLVPRVGGAPDSDPGITTPAEAYRAACAACHGADGRGAPREQVGFEEALPDFTDCSFATREPDADWYAVSHQGGPARAFAPMMPAFGDALTADELALALAHVRTFCPDRRWPRGELNLPRPLVTEKAYPEDEAVWSTTVAAEGPGVVTNVIVWEQRFGARNQYELKLPFGWREGAPADDWTGGLGDVSLGVKRVLHHGLARGSIVSLTGEVILPTGDEADGFGKGFAVFEPFVAYGQILPADAFVQVQTGFELPLEGDADDEAFWRVAAGKSFQPRRFGRVWSPMVELLGARELVGGADIHWDVVPQVQVTLSRRQHVMANLGVRLPVDGSDRDTQVIAYLLWDWFDGGFLDGW